MVSSSGNQEAPSRSVGKDGCIACHRWLKPDGDSLPKLSSCAERDRSTAPTMEAWSSGLNEKANGSDHGFPVKREPVGRPNKVQGPPKTQMREAAASV